MPVGGAVELFYDNAYSEEQIVEFHAGGDRYVRSATRLDPAISTVVQ